MAEAVEPCGIEVIEPAGRSWVWSCSCGETGRARSQTAAQRAAADHVARSLLQACALARRPLVALGSAQSELGVLLDAYRHASRSGRGAA